MISKRLTSVALILVAGNILAGTAASRVENAPADKSGYNLFNPTPEAAMRDFDTDRPDKTNSPITLDAGHVQVEMDVLAFGYDKEHGIKSESWTWGNTNVRLGLTNWADLQLLIPFYTVNRETDLILNRTDRSDGIGDLTVAIKANLWGNDGGDTSGGIGIAVKTPTASHGLGNGKVEGGALFLLGLSLPADFDLGINSGVSIIANDDHGYHADFINSASLSHKIAGPVSAYLEFFSDVPTEHSHDWIGTVDVGVTIMIAKNVQIDTGLNIGVTRAADDLQTFLGLSVRF